MIERNSVPKTNHAASEVNTCHHLRSKHRVACQSNITESLKRWHGRRSAIDHTNRIRVLNLYGWIHIIHLVILYVQNYLICFASHESHRYEVKSGKVHPPPTYFCSYQSCVSVWYPRFCLWRNTAKTTKKRMSTYHRLPSSIIWKENISMKNHFHVRITNQTTDAVSSLPSPRCSALQTSCERGSLLCFHASIHAALVFFATTLCAIGR